MNMQTSRLVLRSSSCCGSRCLLLGDIQLERRRRRLHLGQGRRSDELMVSLFPHLFVAWPASRTRLSGPRRGTWPSRCSRLSWSFGLFEGRTATGLQFGLEFAFVRRFFSANLITTALSSSTAATGAAGVGTEAAISAILRESKRSKDLRPLTISIFQATL